MDQNKGRIVMTSFIDILFQHCPLAWMFHGRKLNAKFNKLHEGALRTYRDQESSFEDLLGYHEIRSINDRNFQSKAWL